MSIVKSRRAFAVLGTAAFLVLAPGTVVGLVPWWISRWQMHTPFFGFAPFRVVGVLLIAVGIPASIGVVRAIRTARRRHAGPGVSDAAT